jgi:N6-L-threonylcarbamoyladenine synthase
LFSIFLRRGAEAGTPPSFPFVGLLASGGHTGIYRVDGPRVGAISELGGTRDDAAGEAFDKVAKILGLPYPGGPAIERRAAHGVATAVPLRAPMPEPGSAEMSFSGIKTQIAQRVFSGGRDSVRVDDVCASFQATVTGVLAAKVVETAAREGVADVVLGGGVAANGELRRRTIELAGARGLRVHVPPIASCTDNAAMIAYAGALRLREGEVDGLDLTAEGQTLLRRRTRKGRGRR